jgi:hypothetical protein
MSHQTLIYTVLFVCHRVVQNHPRSTQYRKTSNKNKYCQQNKRGNKDQQSTTATIIAHNLTISARLSLVST